MEAEAPESVDKVDYREKCLEKVLARSKFGHRCELIALDQHGEMYMVFTISRI